MNAEQNKTLQLQLDEVDMIAYASDTEAVCSFYYDDSIDSDKSIERAQEIVRRVNVHARVVYALEYFFNIMHDYDSSVEKGYVKYAFELAREALTEAKEGFV